MRILAPFGLIAVLFVLAYLSSRDPQSGFFPIMLFGIGIILSLVGTAAVCGDKKGGQWFQIHPLKVYPEASFSQVFFDLSDTQDAEMENGGGQQDFSAGFVHGFVKMFQRTRAA